MLITPEIASEPYCAAAPSRSTSIWSMDATGIKSKSLGAAPLLMPLMFNVALVCRRLPLTSTNTWDAVSPRKVAERTTPLASQPARSGRLNDGMNLLNASSRLGLPTERSCSPVTTSIGVGLVVTVRCSAPRLPVTTTVSRVGAPVSAASRLNEVRLQAKDSGNNKGR